jgi:hypothetical protein
MAVVSVPAVILAEDLRPDQEHLREGRIIELGEPQLLHQAPHLLAAFRLRSLGGFTLRSLGQPEGTLRRVQLSASPGLLALQTGLEIGGPWHCRLLV